MLTNKERAIRQLGETKPFSVGGPIRTIKIEDVAAQKQSTVKLDPIIMKSFSNQELDKRLKKQLWIAMAVAAGLVVTAVLLLKYKIIKL